MRAPRITDSFPQPQCSLNLASKFQILNTHNIACALSAQAMRNCLRLKILPVSDCSPGINSQNSAKPQIPIAQGGVGYTVMARLPNKCLHVMVDGSPCGSPAVRHHHFCYQHKRQREQRLQLDADRARTTRNAPYNLPILEDANSIQLSLTPDHAPHSRRPNRPQSRQPDALLPANRHDEPTEN